MKKLAILLIGKQNSGKTTIWKQIAGLDKNKRLGNGNKDIAPFPHFIELKLNVFIQGQSPTERKLSLQELLEDAGHPKIILCSEQSTKASGKKTELENTINFLESNDYHIKIFWIKEGHGKHCVPVKESAKDILNVKERLGYLPDSYNYDDPAILQNIRKELFQYIQNTL